VNAGGGHFYPEHLVAYSITSGGCACDLVTAGPPSGDADVERERLRRKYERKGWSKAKIQRALDGKPAADPASPIRSDVVAVLAQQLASSGRLELTALEEDVRYVFHTHP